MKLPLFDLQKKKGKDKELPSQFSEEYRPDLIKRAVHALQSASRQAHGAHPDAGMRSASSVSKRRRNYRGSYGFGISRVARKVFSRRGTRMNWKGTFTSQTVGGRRAHPPKAEKEWQRMINLKENRKALRSALAATVLRDVVVKRGHKVPTEYPLLIVVSGDCPLLKAARNIEGIDVVEVTALNAELLAPGTQPGRAALWSEKAVDALKEKKLYL